MPSIINQINLLLVDGLIPLTFAMENVIGAQNQPCPLAKNVCYSREEHISNQQC